MKSFNEYCNEYDKAMIASFAKNPHCTVQVKRCVWILCKWEQDNNINPCDGEKYISKVREVYETDNRLYFQLEQAFTLLNKIELNLN